MVLEGLEKDARERLVGRCAAGAAVGVEETQRLRREG
jgi:hypothetical protein